MKRVLLIPIVALLTACGRPVERGPAESPEQIVCTVELRSWVVAAQGRHLYLQCDCPEPFDHLDGRVEYTKLSLRPDFRPGLSWDDRSRVTLRDAAALPIARMTPGTRLAPPPFVEDPDDRLEFAYALPVETVEALQDDVIFSEPYKLLGPNSNSGIRAVMERAGVELPASVLGGGGMLGAFPGIDKPPGAPIDASAWADLGLPMGPRRPSPRVEPAPEPAGE
jgi:hypothetical protein